MKKKILSMLLATSMVAAALTGCGGGQTPAQAPADTTQTEAPATENKTEKVDADIEQAQAVAEDSGYVYEGTAPITQEAGKSIKILAETSNYTNVDIANAEIVKKVVADSGVAVDWQLVDYNNYQDTVTPMLSTGQADADIILLPDQDTNQVYIKSGLFQPLNQYFGSMPNFTKWLHDNPVMKAELTAEDGNIYYVPGTNVGKDYQPCLMYNVVWLEKAGMKAPETLDDFVALLQYYKDNDMNDNGDKNDEIPMSIMADFLPYMFGPAFGLDLVSGFQADADGNVTYAYADSENYKKYLEFLNGLYKDGLLEVEYTSLDRDKVIERISNDLTGVAYDFSWAMSMMYSNVLPYYDGTADKAFVGAAPLSGDSKGFYVGRVELGNMFAISTNAQDPELCAKFLDYAMSDACQELYQWGIEGESYQVNADGSREFTEKGKDNDWLQQFGINPSFVFPAQQSVASTDVLVADWHAKSNADLRQYVVDPWPFIYSTDAETDTINTYMTDIQTKVDESAAAFITGTRPMTEFDAYIGELDALHLPEVLEIRKQQYARYKKALNG
ncbi:MAG: extracellular solute-binding protein [Lachnospiraceae bacterium]|nr:extracellular solute-binding protein [Lachnospiraceae bacterium]